MVPASSKDVPNDKPIVVGLYGIPGSGKSFELNRLKAHDVDIGFDFYEGSQVIASLVPNGLDDFVMLGEREQLRIREKAIKQIAQTSSSSRRAALVTGHGMFWSDETQSGESVCTPEDLSTYTHILYLKTAPDVIAEQRRADKTKTRPPLSVQRLAKWQAAEIAELRALCLENHILFMTFVTETPSSRELPNLLMDLQRHDEGHNLSAALEKLDAIIKPHRSKLQTVLVLDGDKTLIAEDTGALFWQGTSLLGFPTSTEDPLGTLFRSSQGYSYTAFRQAAMFYEGLGDDISFDARCENVASKMIIHPDFGGFLKNATQRRHVRVIVATCGLAVVWEKIIATAGLKGIKVIGGGRLSNGFVVTPAVKAAIVERLKQRHGMQVWAFGDSPMDLGMLCKADNAVVVVGNAEDRSKSMDGELLRAYKFGFLQASQLLIPSDAPPRLDPSKLPTVSLSDKAFVESILQPLKSKKSPQIFHATETAAAKILMTPTRNSHIAGPSLRKAHEAVGHYLAMQYLAEMIGVERTSIPHVQGGLTDGYRFVGEDKILIVALMRGGEPMALGVSETMPLAKFQHANKPTDVLSTHLDKAATIVLVDSVVNSGKSVVEYLQHIRTRHHDVQIIVVAGVVQDQALARGPLAQALTSDPLLNVVALRVSQNKYTGKGSTDTGNRLFNTT